MPDNKNVEMDRIDKALLELGEHYDTVRIFATRHEEEIEGGTLCISKGSGNWFSQFGQISLWVRLQEDMEARVSANGRVSEGET